MNSLKGHPPEHALLDYAAGTLAADVAEGVGEHIRGCPTCTNYVSMLNEATSPGQGLDPAEIEKARQQAEQNVRRPTQPPRASRPGIPAQSGQAPRASRPGVPTQSGQPPRPSRPGIKAANPSSPGTAKRQSVPPRATNHPPQAPEDQRPGLGDDDLPPTGKRPSIPPTDEDIGFERTSMGRTASAEFDASKTSDELIGSQLGEYKLLERLGQGGMGTVYRAEHALIGKTAAVKVLLEMFAGDNSLAQRMLAEARSVNSIRHPNIVDVFAFGQLPDGRPYLVMELLSGKSLADVLAQKHSLSVEQALHVLSEAFSALEAAHAVGVIHRDLKPDNIFINPAAKVWKVKLLDFGLAKTAGGLDAKLTRPGAVMGTPGYMAPEQVRSADAVSEKTDIYAMGVVAWAMLAGREPFRGNSAIEVMHQHLTVPAPALATAADDVPPALDALVNRMLAKDPDQRPSAADARAEIEAIKSGTAVAPAAAYDAGTRLKTWPCKDINKITDVMQATHGQRHYIVEVKFHSYENVLLVAKNTKTDRTMLSKFADRLAQCKTHLQQLAAREWEEGHGGYPADDMRHPKGTHVWLEDALVLTPQGPVDARAAAGAGTEAQEPRRWPCDTIISISEPMWTVGGGYRLMLLKFRSLPNLMIVADKGSAGMKSFDKIRKAIVRCEGTQKVLLATKYNDNHPGFYAENLTQPKGVKVNLLELSIEDP